MKAFDTLWSDTLMMLLNDIPKTLPALRNYMLRNSRIVTFLKSGEFFFPEREGRILLGDKSGVWAVV